MAKRTYEDFLREYRANKSEEEEQERIRREEESARRVGQQRATYQAYKNMISRAGGQEGSQPSQNNVAAAPGTAGITAAMSVSLGNATENAGMRYDRTSAAGEAKFAENQLNKNVSSEGRSLIERMLDIDTERTNKALQGLTTGGSVMYTNDELKRLDEQNQQEKKLRNQYGENYAKYKQYAQEVRDQKEREKQREQIKAAINTGNPVKDTVNKALLTGADIVTNPIAATLAPLETLRSKTYADKAAPVNTNSDLYALQNLETDIEQAVSDTIDSQAGKFAYGIGTSMGKSAFSMAIGGAVTGTLGASGGAAKFISQATTLPTFGAGAYATTLQEAQDRGINKDRAIATAAVAGVAEMATEAFSLDHFWDIAKSKGVKAAKSLLWDSVAQAVIEGSEEGASEIINKIADGLINKDQSEYHQAIETYMKNGLSREEAEREAKKDVFKEIGLSIAGGAISGGIMGGGANLVKFVNDTSDAKALFDNGDYKGFAEAIDTDEGSYQNTEDRDKAVKAQGEAERLAAKQERGEKVTNKEKRQLWSMIQETMDAAAKNRTENVAETAENVQNMTNSDINMPENVQAERKTDQNVTEENWTPQIRELTTEDVPEQYRNRITLSETEAVEHMNKAQSPEALVQAYNSAEHTPYIEQTYNLNSGRLQAEGKASEAEIYAASNSPTVEEAYLMGANGQEISGPTSPETAEAYSQGQIVRVQMEQRARISERPTEAVARTSDGGDLIVKGIKKINAEDAVLETNQGDVLLSDTFFDAPATQKLYNDAENYSTKGAKIYIDAYPGTIPVNTYSDQMKRYYTAGKLGLSFDTTLEENGYINKYVSEEDLKKMYEAGKEQEKADHKENKKVNTAKKGTGHVSDSREIKNTNIPKKTIKQLAKKLNIDIELVESLEGDTRGYFKPSAAKLVLDANEDTFNTLIHEGLGEFLEAYNPEGFEEVQTAMLEWYRHKIGAEAFGEKIDAYRAAYQEHEGSKSTREAANEMVNDMLSALFSTEDGMNDFANWLMSEEANNYDGPHKQTIIERIAQFIQDLVDEIKSILSNSKLPEATRTTLEMEADRASELRTKLLDAMDQAIENRDSVAVQTEDTKDEGKRNPKKINGKAAENVKRHDYSYDTLTKKKDIALNRPTDFGMKDLTFDKDTKRGQVVKVARENIKKYNGQNGLKDNELFNKDLGSIVSIGADGLKHGGKKITERMKDAAVNLPAYFENAIVLNEGDGQETGNKYNPDKAYILFGAYEDGDDIIVCRIVVNHFYGKYTFSDERDSLYALNIKKEEVEGQSSRPANSGSTTSSDLSVSQLLEIVKKHFPNDVSDDVADRLEYTKGESDIRGLRYSINIDNNGKSLTPEQQEYFKDSKIRDDEGRLMEVYHGTPYGGFTEFKNDLNYFTPNKEYADRYHNPSASSVRGRYEPATNEMTYAGYLNITKPFDISDDETWDIFVKDYIEGGWSASIAPGTPIREIRRITENGIDWTEADNLKEFFDEAGYDYDGLILDEGGDPLGNGEVYKRGSSYVAFNSNQFKNIDNENPTKDDDIRRSINIENMTTEEMDAVYEKAVKENDYETMNDMVRQQATRRGYTSPMLYHGTDKYGFTSFSMARLDDNASIFVSEDRKVAASYSGDESESVQLKDAIQGNIYDLDDEEIIRLAKEYLNSEYRLATEEEVAEDKANYRDRLINAADDIESKLSGVDLDKYDAETVDRVINSLRGMAEAATSREFSAAYSSGIVDSASYYVDSEEAGDILDEVIDVKVDYAISNLMQKAGADPSNFVTKNGVDIEWKNAIITDLEHTLKRGIYNLYAKEDNLYEVDAAGANWDNITPPEEMKKEGWTGKIKTRDISEYARMKGYSGVRILNVKDSGGKVEAAHYPSNIRIVFDNSNIKSADPVTTDDNGTVVPLSERFNSDDNDLRFSLKAPVEETKDLIAVHNMSETELLETLKLGGLPMPSIAIIKAEMGHDKYGSVSILFNKETIDPKFMRKNKVYSGDAYTPEFPQLGYKIDSKKVEKVRDRIMDITGEYYDQLGYAGLDSDNVSDKVDRNRGNIIDAYGNNDVLRYAYMKDSGNDIDLPMREERLSSYFDNEEIEYLALMFNLQEARDLWQDGSAGYKQLKEDGRLDKILDKINAVEKKKYGKLYDKVRTKEIEFADLDHLLNAIIRYHREGVRNIVDKLAIKDTVDEYIEANRKDYEKWLNDLFDGVVVKAGIRNQKDIFTPSGNRRSWDSLYDDYNLDNIVKAMRAEPETGSGFGGYSFFGSSNREFESIEDIKSESDRLRKMDEKEYEEAKKEIENEVLKIARRLKPNPDYSEYSLASDIAEAVAKRKTKSGIKKFLSEWYDVSDADVDEIVELARRVQSLPTGYFEAKPQRAVQLNEIAKIVLPDNAEQDLIDAIEEQDLPYSTYKAGDKEDRKRAVNDVENIRFSVKVDDESPRVRVGAETVIPGIRYAYDPNEFMPVYEGSVLDDIFNGDVVADEGGYMDISGSEGEAEKVSQILSVANESLKGHKVDSNIINDIAKDIRSKYGNNVSQSELADNLNTFFEYMQETEDLNYNEMMKVLTQVSYPVIERTGVVDPIQQERYDNFKKYLRGTKIRLNEKQVADINHIFGSVAEFKKLYRGILNISKDGESGIGLDQIWGEIEEASDGFVQSVQADKYYGSDSDAGLPIILAEAIDLMKPEIINSFGQDQEQAALDLSMDILRRYYDATIKQIEEDKATETLKNGVNTRDALKAAKAKLTREANAYRKATKEEYDARLKEAEEKAEKAIEEGRYWQGLAMAAQGNKEAMAEERKRWKEKEAELRQQLKRVAKQTAGKSKSLVDYLDAQEKEKNKKKIMQTGNRLMRMVYAPNDTRHMPEILRKPVGEFLQTIDFVSHRARQGSKEAAKWYEKMRDLAYYLSSLDEMEDPNATMINMLIDDDLISDMDSFATSKKQISRMNAKELKDLADILQRLSTAIGKANETFANERYRTIDEMAKTSLNEIHELRNTKEGKAIVMSARDFFTKQLEDPVTYFESLGPAAATNYKALLEGFDLRSAHIRETSEYMKDVTKDIKDMYKWSTDKLRVGDVEMTVADAMSLYELVKREQARPHLLTGGVKIETVLPGGKKTLSVDEIHLGYEGTMAFINQLTPEQIKVADAMQSFMANNCAEWGNRTSMKLFGYEKFKDPNYFPIKTDSKTRATNNREATKNQSLFANKNFSATKELTEMANNTIILTDIFDTFADHVTDMATYDGMVLPQMDAMRWFNYTEVSIEPGEEADKKHYVSIRKEIQRTMGEAGNKYFTDLMLGINGMEPKSRSAGFISNAISRYKKVAVMAKIRVAIQQPTAMVRALDEMDAKYLSKALASTNPAKYSKIAKDKSMLAWWKGQGYYETYLGKNIRDMIVGKQPIVQKAEDAAGWGAQTMDDLTWGVLYHATEYEIEDTRKDLKRGTEEFDKAVVSRFEDVVTRTQVVDTMLHRTDIMRNNNELVKMATSFMAEPLKTYNMLLRSAMKLAEKPRNKELQKRMIRAIMVYLLNNAVLTAVTSAWDAFRKDDDKTSFIGRWAQIYRDTFIDNVNPVNMIPVLKDVVDIFSKKLQGDYYSGTDMTYDGIEKIGQFAAHMSKRLSGERINKTDYGLFMEGVQAGSIVSGVPIYNVLNDLESIYNGVFENIQRTQSTSEYADLKDAISKDGDVVEEVKKLKDSGKEDKSIKATITRSYKDEYLATTDKTEKANMKNKLIKAYMAAGDTREDALEKINKWEEK